MKKLFLSLFVLTACLATHAQTDSLQQYAGKYKFPDGSPVTEIIMTVESGMLMGASALGTSEFKPTSTPDVFDIVAFGGTATFKRKDGKVSGVQILVGDVNIEGTKTEGLAIVGSSSPLFRFVH